jgi:hypothetical protein
MENLLINVQLTRLNRVGRILLDDRDGKKMDCLVIPIEHNHLSIAANNEVYLNLVGWASENLNNGQTHLIKPSVPKERLEKMTEEQKRNIPIVGNVRPLQKMVKLETYSVPSADEGPDLPF